RSSLPSGCRLCAAALHPALATIKPSTPPPPPSRPRSAPSAPPHEGAAVTAPLLPCRAAGGGTTGEVTARPPAPDPGGCRHCEFGGVDNEHEALHRLAVCVPGGATSTLSSGRSPSPSTIDPTPSSPQPRRPPRLFPLRRPHRRCRRTQKEPGRRKTGPFHCSSTSASPARGAAIIVQQRSYALTSLPRSNVW
ncbi:unnamed protein product, partial [Urochloa humidicola]